jgi:DNA-binding SARP family transcriptional activator
MLEIRLLGEFDVRLNGQPIEIPSRPAQSLLAYLVLNAETKHRREKLAGLLWPDSEEANARSNLRHALWRLRKAIGEKYFITDKVTIAFKTLDDCELDIYYLEDKALEAENLIEFIKAASVYGGDLLPGFYESWVVLERERLRSAFEHVIQRLLDLLIEKGSWLEIIEWGERWIALGHAPEPAYRALMIAHRGLGDSSGVAAVYQRCRDTLREELGVEPSEQTRAMYERLSKGGDPAAVEQAYAEREASTATSIRMLLKQWRQKGVEVLELASLAMVHAARTAEPYEPEDAKLLVRSALHHEVDVEPWLKRAGSPRIAVAAMDEVLETYPRPRVRMRIVEALKGLKGEEADEALLRIAISDDASSVRSEAAVAASQRGKHDAVVMKLVEEINVGGDGAAMSAFVSVIDEVGLPKQVGPYPRLPVAVALAQKRWREKRTGILRHIARATFGGAVAMMVISVISLLQLQIVLPEEFREATEFVPLPIWIFTNILLGLVWGGLQGASTGLATGLADAFWEGKSWKRMRILLASLAGLVHSVFILFTASTSNVWSSQVPSVYVPVYLIYGLIVGASFSLVVPKLDVSISIRQQLSRSMWVSLILMLFGAISVFIAYGGNLNDRNFRLDLFMFIVTAILFPLGFALALTRRRGENSGFRS